MVASCVPNGNTTFQMDFLSQIVTFATIFLTRAPSSVRRPFIIVSLPVSTRETRGSTRISRDHVVLFTGSPPDTREVRDSRLAKRDRRRALDQSGFGTRFADYASPWYYRGEKKKISPGLRGLRYHEQGKQWTALSNFFQVEGSPTRPVQYGSGFFPRVIFPSFSNSTNGGSRLFDNSN